MYFKKLTTKFTISEVYNKLDSSNHITISLQINCVVIFEKKAVPMGAKIFKIEFSGTDIGEAVQRGNKTRPQKLERQNI